MVCCWWIWSWIRPWCQMNQVAFCPQWIVLNEVGWTPATGHFARSWQHHQVWGPLWCFFASLALWYQSVFRGGNPLGDVSSGFCQALVRQLPAFKGWCWHGLCCACLLWPECLYPLQGRTASDQGRATSPYLLLSIVSGGCSGGCTSGCRATAQPVVTYRPLQLLLWTVAFGSALPSAREELWSFTCCLF